MKKAVTFLLTAVLLLSVSVFLCSCGDNSNTAAETETKTTAEKISDTVEASDVDAGGDALQEETTCETADTISNNSPYDEGESNAPDFSELLASENGIEIYGKNNLELITPADGLWDVVLLVKNNNDYAVEIDHGSAFDITADNFTGSLTDYCRDYTAGIHPNGSDFIIEPNAELQIVFDISLPNFNNQAESVEGDLIFNYEFRVLESSDSAGDNVVADINLAVNSYVTYLGRDARSDESNRNATIKGKIVDVNSNPISGVEVENKNAIDEGEVMVQTDENGEFELKVTACKSACTNMWHECVLKLSHISYDEKYICVYPKTGETNEVLIVLSEPSQKLSYENTATVDLGIQAYSYDTDASRSVIAFTPFHSGLSYGDVADKVSINVTDYDGNVKFEYPLNAEAPWVSVSDDGQYVLAIQAVDAGNENSTYIVLLDENGDTAYTKDIGKEVDTPQGIQTETIHSRCAELSHDNSYLAIGSDDGGFWLLDWQNDTVLWSYQTHGQVRNIVFNEENSVILVSSGDAFMYGFDIDGNLLFKTYVGSWATDMELADNYLAYTLKTGFDSVGVIDITSGEKVWTYAARARGSGLAVSKDHKYLWWGNDVSSVYSCINNVVFNLETGEIAYVLDTYAGQEAMYSDDGRYLVVKTATELEVFETENYSQAFYIPIIDKSGENAASINQTVAVNGDASRIVAAFNNDPSCRFYGQAYYFELQDNGTPEAGPNNNDAADAQDEPADEQNEAGPYRIDDNDIIFERDTEYTGFDVYDNVTINKDISVSLSTVEDIGDVNGFIINFSLTVEDGACLFETGDGSVSPRIEFAEGASATGIDLYSEGGDLLNINGEFINDSGATLAFIWSDGKWMVDM